MLSAKPSTNIWLFLMIFIFSYNQFFIRIGQKEILPHYIYRFILCSIDKATSVAIHILPGIFHYLIRWCPKLSPDNQLPNLLPLSWREQFLYPLGIYFTWQLIYFGIQFTIIEKDATLVTSLRFMAGDAKNPCTIYGTKLAVKLSKVLLKLYISIALHTVIPQLTRFPIVRICITQFLTL